VPISLYISIEIVKTIQAYFISQDIEMYYEGYDTPCVPKSWNISDDLGQIEYVPSIGYSCGLILTLLPADTSSRTRRAPSRRT
jgi:hypothetical protein